MSYKKVTEADREGKGVSGLPDVPQLTTGDMQAKLDELGNMGIDALNHLIDELESAKGADSLGAKVPDGITAEPNVGSILMAYGLLLNNLENKAHEHSNKDVLNSITSLVKQEYDRVASILNAVNSFDNGVIDDAGSIPTGHAIVSYVSRLGGGDMLKATYDANNDGVVDNASAVQGHTVSTNHDIVLHPDENTNGQLLTASALNQLYNMLTASIATKIPISNIKQELSTETNKVPSNALLNNINTSITATTDFLRDVSIKIVDRFTVKAGDPAHAVHFEPNHIYAILITCHKLTANNNSGAIAGGIGLTLRYMDRYEVITSGVSSWKDNIVNANIIAPNANIVFANDIPGRAVNISAKAGYRATGTVIDVPLPV
jgi:hypothetical protein